MSKRETCRIEIRFADIDVMGHVNNAIYLNYFEQARIDFFKKQIGTEWDWTKHGIILGRNEIDYIDPVLFSDDLHIETWCSRIGTKSLEFSYEVFVPGSEKKIKAQGKSVMVCFDYHEKKTIPVPEMWKQKLV
jgi:acyl-CoA thioester hydrolase